MDTVNLAATLTQTDVRIHTYSPKDHSLKFRSPTPSSHLYNVQWQTLTNTGLESATIKKTTVETKK